MSFQTVKEVSTKKNHVICPRCKEADGVIDHLMATKGVREYTWYCDNESCGCKYRFSLLDGKVLSVEDLGLSKHAPFVILSTNNSELEQAVYIVVKGNLIDIPVGTKDPLTNEEMNNKEYFYRQHTCPTNFVRTELVMQNLDTDPHGAFHFVDAIMPETLLEKYGAATDYDDPEKEGWDNYLTIWAKDVAEFEIATRDAVKGIQLKPTPQTELMELWIAAFGDNPERCRHLLRWVVALADSDNISQQEFLSSDYVITSCDKVSGILSCVEYRKDTLPTDEK